MNHASKHILTAAFALFALVAAPLALAADLTDVGSIDQGAIGNLPQFISANRQLAEYKAGLDRQFQSEVKRARSQTDQQRIVAAFQQKLLDRQRAVMGPLFARAQTAIASVSSSKNLTVVVDKRIVIFGGQDITKSVIDLLQSPGQIVPPVSTPGPSEVGSVDQTAIDQIPKLKTASDEFAKYDTEQKSLAQQQMAKAKTDADRQAIFKNYEKTVGDRRDQVLKPLVDQTQSVIADVAKKKNLLLVIDRGDLIYGGTDITADVQSALK
ncbi:MAG: OmpH family outer membrane protein [Candidatus Eremiobacteraeota bacterium]|nr:OmpH family outer membrane protein [Candidatus Eremiobacteraeota bacterium]